MGGNNNLAVLEISTNKSTDPLTGITGQLFLSYSSDIFYNSCCTNTIIMEQRQVRNNFFLVPTAPHSVSYYMHQLTSSPFKQSSYFHFPSLSVWQRPELWKIVTEYFSNKNMKKIYGDYMLIIRILIESTFCAKIFPDSSWLSPTATKRAALLFMVARDTWHFDLSIVFSLGRVGLKRKNWWRKESNESWAEGIPPSSLT